MFLFLKTSALMLSTNCQQRYLPSTLSIYQNKKEKKNVPEKYFLQRTYIFIFPKVYNFSINPTDKKKKSLKKHKIFVISKPQQKASFVFYVIKNS